MKYQVDKSRYINFLGSRPAMLQVLTNITEDIAVACMEKHGAYEAGIEIYKRLPENLQNVRVSLALIKARCDYAKGKYNCFLNPDFLSIEVLKQFSKEERILLIDSSNGACAISRLPDASYEEWLYAVNKGYLIYGGIPKEYVTKELLLALLSQSGRHLHFGKYNGLNLKGLDLWDKDFALQAVTVCPEVIHSIPFSVITREVLDVALVANADVDDLDLPKEIWTQELANKAMSMNANNARYIPWQFLTQEAKLEIAKSNGSVFLELRDFSYPLLVMFLAHNYIPKFQGQDRDLILKEIQRHDYETLLMDIIKENQQAFDHFLQAGFVITSAQWIKIISLYPTSLFKIPKREQTTEIIDAFFSKASAEDIDSMAHAINLTKVKPHHAPLLIGCKDPIMVEIRNKHLKGDDNKVGDNTVEIDMAPSEYAKIKQLL